MSKWHKGPSPSIGWWPASMCGDPYSLRWWNGTRWSQPVMQFANARYAAKKAAVPSNWPNDNIEWTDRPANWPARSKT